MIASLRAVVARSLRLPRRRQLLGLASGFAAAWLASGVASYAASPEDDAPAAAAVAPPAPIDLRRYPNLRPVQSRPPARGARPPPGPDRPAPLPESAAVKGPAAASGPCRPARRGRAAPGRA